MDLIIGPEVIGSYKRLSYKSWYALAEFVDNSTQAYLDNKDILDSAYKEEGTNLRVSIKYIPDANPKLSKIIIEDNSIGMNKEELNNAVFIGRPPANTSGRSKYGLGLKTAACWFGDLWSLRTKKIGATEEHQITFDVEKVINGKLDLNYVSNSVENEKDHYTIIEITDLNQILYPKTVGKIRNYLRSMFRIDISSNKLNLVLQNEPLKWDYQEEIYNRVVKNQAGELILKNFDFLVSNKQVRGWAAVFENGSRARAGFSVIQADRVITGWPDSYKPESLFGSQEGGVNDLVNQRLVGELYLNGFDVSHTKDEILLKDEEREELESILEEELAALREFAKSYRKYKADERVENSANQNQALNELSKELESKEIKDLLFVEETVPVDLLKTINESLTHTVVKDNSPTLCIKINTLQVSLYLIKNLSPNDPYVIIESTKSEDSVIVIINGAHPYWINIKSAEAILDFFRHCAYDGVAEWKAYFKAGNMQPDTIKNIKDNLLRLPFKIENNTIIPSKKD